MCRSTWEVTGGLYGSYLSSQAWGFSKGIWCGRLAKCPVSGLLPCGQSVLSPVAPRWPVQSFSSPEVVTTAWFRKRGRVCVKELCWQRNREKYCGSSEVIEYCAAFCSQFSSAFQEVAINPLPFAINLLRPFPLIPSRVFLMHSLSVGQMQCWRCCSWKDYVCLILSVEYLRLELGSRSWEGSTCTVLPFPGSGPGGITLCLDGGISRQ